MPEYKTIGFAGGINQNVDATRVESGEYYALLSGRTRENVISPIREPRDLTSGLPTDQSLQGIYSAGRLQLVVSGGQVYFKNFDPESANWNKIPNLQMSSDADRVYIELVPASYKNYKRLSYENGNISAPIKYSQMIRGAPQCAVVCDGINQPWAVFPDATARVLNNYAQWTPENREYVPIGVLPVYHDNILYMVGKDLSGAINQIFRSVTGRPLDFIVAVDENGDKTSTQESEGGAPALAHRIAYGDLTAIAKIPAVKGAFYGSTISDSWLVIPDYEDLVYGEPTFSNQYLFSVGALNENCIVDALGNTALVHYSGIRDFNSIMTLLNEGKNSPFSRKINSLIKDITQDYAAAVSYDNYAIFAVKTRYGIALIWYDTLSQQFTSIDQIAGLGQIKQFSVVQTKTTRRLLFITQDNKLYEWEGGTKMLNTKVYFRDFLPTIEGSTEHYINKVSLQFSTIKQPGHVQVSTIVDSKITATKAVSLSVDEVVDGQYDPIPYPLTTKAAGGPVIFDFEKVQSRGFRAGALLSWNAETSLLMAKIDTIEDASSKPDRLCDTAQNNVQAETIFFIGDDGTTREARQTLNKNIYRAKPDYVIGCGDHSYETGSVSDVSTKLLNYWNSYRLARKFFAVPGNHDLDTANGEAFFQALLQAPTRYFKVATSHVDIYCCNSGIKTNGTQIEPDNLDEATITESRQMRWLKERLSESRTNRRFAVVVWHHPPYTSSASYYPGIAAMQNIPLQQWGANALVCGHAHLYERLVKDGFPYFISGVGSDDRFHSVNSTLSPYSYVTITQKVGFLKMVANPLSLRFSFVDINNTEYDSFTIDL